MKKVLKRSVVAAALMAAATITLSTAQADPLFYKTRPGSRPPTPSASRNAGAPVPNYSSGSTTTRSFSYAPSSPSQSPSTVRSFSYAPSSPSTSSTVRSYSYAPGTTQQRAPVRYYYSPSNRCYCQPR